MTVERNVIEVVKEIARKIKDKGGRAFYVGGFVRDEFTYNVNKDIDIEIYGLPVSEVKSILAEYGTVNEVGESFGVLMVSGLPVDWTFPRTEKCIGKSHRDFDVTVNPFASYEEACRRRDFTINAIMKDVLTDEIVDPFNGVKDIKDGILRCVNPTTFVEDPLRVYRAAQFVARFNLTVDKNTMELLKTIDVSSLPKERVYEEYKKMLLKAERPSLGLQVLKEISLLHPLLKNMIGCKQKKEFHPEGDVWNHTLLVVDEAAKLRDMVSDPEILMWSALLHDIGKSEVVSEDGSSICHDEIGVELAMDFLKAFTNEGRLLQNVPIYVKEHMKLVQLWAHNSSTAAVMRLVSRVPDFNILIALSKTDFLGRGGVHDFTPVEEFIKVKTKDMGTKKPAPLVTGWDLISLGYKPSPLFGKILAWAFDLQLEGETKENILKEIPLVFPIKDY